jgi:hypothetical protein
MGFTHVRLTIGAPLGVEIAQDRSSALPTPGHRACSGVAAGPNLDLSRGGAGLHVCRLAEKLPGVMRHSNARLASTAATERLCQA